MPLDSALSLGDVYLETPMSFLVGQYIITPDSKTGQNQKTYYRGVSRYGLPRGLDNITNASIRVLE